MPHCLRSDLTSKVHIYPLMIFLKSHACMKLTKGFPIVTVSINCYVYFEV